MRFVWFKFDFLFSKIGPMMQGTLAFAALRAGTLGISSQVIRAEKKQNRCLLRVANWRTLTPNWPRTPKLAQHWPYIGVFFSQIAVQQRATDHPMHLLPAMVGNFGDKDFALKIPAPHWMHLRPMLGHVAGSFAVNIGHFWGKDFTFLALIKKDSKLSL